MQICSLQSLSYHLNSLHTTTVIFGQPSRHPPQYGRMLPAAAMPPGAWSGCPSHIASSHPAPCSYYRSSLHPWNLRLVGAAAPRTRPIIGSSSDSFRGDVGQLQPKPQAKHHRLSVGSHFKPRRWHRVAQPLPAPPSDSAPAGSEASDAVAPAAATRLGREEQVHQLPRRDGRRQKQQQHGGASRSQRAAVQRRSSRQPDDDEHSGEDGDEDGAEEFLGLSEEAIEAMVFASANASGASTSTASNSALDTSNTIAAATVGSGQVTSVGQRRGRPGKGVPEPDVAAATAAVASANLPYEFKEHVLAAIHSGSVSSNAAVLTDQLKHLHSAVATASGSGGGHGDVLLSSTLAIAKLLDCSAEAAAAILVDFPGYISVVNAAGSQGDGMERLRSFSGMLKSDLAEARDALRQNPALLLVPYDTLRKTLTALSGATGLSQLQATALVSPYMFSDLLR